LQIAFSWTAYLGSFYAGLLKPMTDSSHDPSAAEVVGLLVIGYGNELRSDDGVGPRVAAAIAEMQLSGVQAIACHQLTPELAEPIASARAVIFVDAACDSGGEAKTQRIEPSTTTRIVAHASNPQSLLALARELFGHCPPAWMISVPAVTFDFGEQLSSQAEKGLAMTLVAIQELWARHHSDGTVATTASSH
jgi:hydrogenase maturation protease